MPDTIDSYEFNGITYLVTANEGDCREYLTDADSAEDCAAQGGFDFDDGAAGDLGPESIKFVAAADSPTGNALLIGGNEVSGTTALFPSIC